MLSVRTAGIPGFREPGSSLPARAPVQTEKVTKEHHSGASGDMGAAGALVSPSKLPCGASPPRGVPPTSRRDHGNCFSQLGACVIRCRAKIAGERTISPGNQ